MEKFSDFQDINVKDFIDEGDFFFYFINMY